MAITTLAGALGGIIRAQDYFKNNQSNLLTGNINSSWQSDWLPAAAATPSAGLAGEALTTGGIPWANPSSGNSYLLAFTSVGSGKFGRILLFDRLWQNSGLSATSTSPQTINSVAWPARDMNGSTNGDGVMIALEIYVGMGSGGTGSTISYTNQSNVSGRTGTIPTLNEVSAAAFHPFRLDAGDTGVRSIQSYTNNTTYTSGTFGLVAYRFIAALGPLTVAPHRFTEMGLASGFPRLYNSSVLWTLRQHASGASGQEPHYGQVIVTQG